MTPAELKAFQASFLTGVDRLGFKLVGAMARIFGSLAAKDEETYWYNITSTDGQGFVDLTAVIGNTAQAQIQITQEADFIGTRFLQESLDPVAGTFLANPSWRVRIRDNSSDRELMPSASHVTTVAGSAQRSVPFTKNRLFRRNSTISLDFENLQAVATRIFFTCQGYKLFDEAALDLTRRR